MTQIPQRTVEATMDMQLLDSTEGTGSDEQGRSPKFIKYKVLNTVIDANLRQSSRCRVNINRLELLRIVPGNFQILLKNSP